MTASVQCIFSGIAADIRQQLVVDAGGWAVTVGLGGGGGGGDEGRPRSNGIFNVISRHLRYPLLVGLRGHRGGGVIW